MNILPYENFVNSDTINVFTDASIVHRKVIIENTEHLYYFGSPGCVVFIGETMIDLYNTILPITTNNQLEITAIQYGLYYGLRHANLKNIKNINIFSDSRICIYGIREWIFNWIANMKDGLLYNTSGLVANQQHFISIIKTILDYNKPVNFYHVRGHRNINSFSDRKKFNESFMRENKVPIHLDERLISYLISGNDMVDTITRKSLDNLTPQYLDYYDNVYKKIEAYRDTKERIFNIQDAIKSLDLNRYKELIGGNLK